jgi:hypothetical protein
MRAPAWALSQVIGLRVQLEASTNENGPLPVLPGSHAVGILTNQSGALVPRDGLLAMRPLLIILYSSFFIQGAGHSANGVSEFD